MTSIASSLDSLLNYIRRDRLQVISPADFGEEINEGCREVHSVVAELSRFVVPWEDMLTNEITGKLGIQKNKYSHDSCAILRLMQKEPPMDSAPD